MGYLSIMLVNLFSVALQYEATHPVTQGRRFRENIEVSHLKTLSAVQE